MNTRIRYVYRDANNYKESDSVVVAGRMTFEDLRSLFDEDEDGFIPTDVGWRHPGRKFSTGFPTDADHPWCDIGPDGFEETEDAPTDLRTPAEIVDAFRRARDAGWPGGNEVARSEPK